MNINTLPTGKEAPSDIYAFIEIAALGSVKYEPDHESGFMFVDRFLHTQMTYPTNYGSIPQTKSDDGDEMDVLVVTEIPVQPSTVIRCRPIGVIKMEDESGMDEKIIAVPHTKINPYYNDVEEVEDLPEILRKKIEHFFTHYKDLEPNKWVKVQGWGSSADAKKLIEEGMARYKA